MKKKTWIIASVVAVLMVGITVLIWQSQNNSSASRDNDTQADFLQQEKNPRQQEHSQQENPSQQQEIPSQQEDRTQEPGRSNTPPPNTPPTGGLSEGNGDPNEEIILDAGVSNGNGSSGGDNSGENAGDAGDNNGGNTSTVGDAPDDDTGWGPMF